MPVIFASALLALPSTIYGWITNTDLLQARGKADKYEIGLLVDTDRIDIVGFSDPREEID